MDSCGQYIDAMGISTNLDQLMIARGIRSQSQLSRASGVPQPTINRILKGVTENPDLITLQKLAQALSVPVGSLTGEDDLPLLVPREPLRQGSNVKHIRGIVSYDTLEELPDGDFVLIPHVDLRLSAGNGKAAWEVSQKDPLPFMSSFIKALGIHPKNAVCMKIDGRSMEPLLFHGDTAILDMGVKTIPSDGAVFGFMLNDELMVKKLYRLPDGGIRVESKNAEYGPTFDLPESKLERMELIGRVKYRSGVGDF